MRAEKERDRQTRIAVINVVFRMLFNPCMSIICLDHNIMTLHTVKKSYVNKRKGSNS